MHKSEKWKCSHLGSPLKVPYESSKGSGLSSTSTKRFSALPNRPLFQYLLLSLLLKSLLTLAGIGKPGLVTAWMLYAPFSLLLPTSPDRTSRAGFSFWPHLNMLEAITASWVSTWNFTYNLSQPKSLFLIKHFPLCLTFLNTLVHFRVLVIQLVLEKKKWEPAMCSHFFHLKALFQYTILKTSSTTSKI